ncbi:MAG: HetP family heterocyst commitment protein [Elainella sp. Prado103]|jgi:hypothetical protein|nr:HetP family heterocyst commitment protein [Elainella sp. Prado103]
MRSYSSEQPDPKSNQQSYYQANSINSPDSSGFASERSKSPGQTKSLDQKMPPEPTEVINAILEGKYSWACVLILRASGYNPLHYMPYRTYKRLLKENSK